jgi:hypothetical protein
LDQSILHLAYQGLYSGFMVKKEVYTWEIRRFLL